jgi:hypothetical protein
MNLCKGFHLINVVWGDEYTDFFLKLCLPTQLSPRNIPAFKNVERAVYKLYTTAKDAETIIKHPIYSILSETIDTEIKIFNFSEKFLRDYKHPALTYCHQHAAVSAYKENCGLIFLVADGAYADGSFENLIKISNKGKRAIMLCTYRIAKETFVPQFMKLFNPHGGLTISASPRELVKLSLKHLHPTTKVLFWGENGCQSWHPSMLFWSVGDEGIIAKSFHAHPLMIIPSRKDILPYPTIDGKYVSLVCPNLEDDVYVVKDSDEIYYSELSKSELYPEHIRPEGTTDYQDVAEWMTRATDSFHRYCFKNHTILHHANDIIPKWEKVKKESDQARNEIFNEFENAYHSVSYY